MEYDQAWCEEWAANGLREVFARDMDAIRKIEVAIRTKVESLYGTTLVNGDNELSRAAIAATLEAVGEPVAFRFVHLDYAGRKVSRYGVVAERVNGHDPIEVHPLYSLSSLTQALTSPENP